MDTLRRISTCRIMLLIKNLSHLHSRTGGQKIGTAGHGCRPTMRISRLQYTPVKNRNSPCQDTLAGNSHNDFRGATTAHLGWKITEIIEVIVWVHYGRQSILAMIGTAGQCVWQSVPIAAVRVVWPTANNVLVPVI